jgi:hypothetical protein
MSQAPGRNPGDSRRPERINNMGKFKPFIITGIVSIIAVEIWSRYLRSKVFPAG